MGQERHPSPHHFEAPTDPTGRLAVAEVFGTIGAKKFEEHFGTPAHHAAQMETYRTHIAAKEAEMQAEAERVLWMKDFNEAQGRGLNTSDAFDAAEQAAETRKQGTAEVRDEVRTDIAESMGSV